MEGRIHSIESFGTVDGPGIRFVVFFQGCPMRCSYCHNPDTWNINGGTLRSAEDLLLEYEKNREFYKKGGLTITGGEPLLQMEFLTEVFTLFKERGIHTCLDTSGGTFSKEPSRLSQFERLVQVTDLVLLDIKHMDDEKHKKLTGITNQGVLEFAGFLAEHRIPVWIRYVAVPGITDQEEELFKLGTFLGGLTNVKALDVLPYHTMGVEKYEALGIAYPFSDVEESSKEHAFSVREKIIEGMRERIRYSV